MNLIVMGIFAIIFLMLLGIISGSSYDTQSLIQTQFNRMSCPMPSSAGLWNNTGTLMYTNGTYNYRAVNNNTLTLTCTEVHTPDGFDYFYGSPTLAIAGGVFFINDFFASIFDKIGAFFIIIGTVLSPAGFNILGFTITDIGTFAQIIIFSIYTMCYILIGAMIYKIVSPFSGAS